MSFGSTEIPYLCNGAPVISLFQIESALDMVYLSKMLTFFIRCCLWLFVLAGMPFFWVAIFDAGEDGVMESFGRNAAEVPRLLVQEKPPR
jgi:hypothetical protein